MWNVFSLLDSSPKEKISKPSSNSKSSKSSLESSGEAKQKPSSSSLTRWLSAVPSKSSPRPQSLSAASTARGSKSVRENPQRARAEKLKPEQNKDSDDSELDSETEAVSDEIDSEVEDDGFEPRVQEQILQFFQEASVDELSLIAGCSLKKAQKIISLRPFTTWKDVVRVFVIDTSMSNIYYTVFPDLYANLFFYSFWIYSVVKLR